MEETQCDMILALLKKDGKVDNFTLIHSKRSLRLGARIHDLRKRGYDITTEVQDSKNTVYRLAPGEQPARGEEAGGQAKSLKPKCCAQGKLWMRGRLANGSGTITWSVGSCTRKVPDLAYCPWCSKVLPEELE
jgi:hypothetical protein